jgi:hypothetical protein
MLLEKPSAEYASLVLARNRHRILEVEDETIGVEEPRVRKEIRLVGREVEPAPSPPVLDTGFGFGWGFRRTVMLEASGSEGGFNPRGYYIVQGAVVIDGDFAPRDAVFEGSRLGDREDRRAEKTFDRGLEPYRERAGGGSVDDGAVRLRLHQSSSTSKEA